jgi:hypothetical protein
VRGERFDARSFAAGMAGSLLLLMVSLAGGNVLLAGRAPEHQTVSPVLAAIPRQEAIPAIAAKPARHRRLALRNPVPRPRALIVPVSLSLPAAVPEMPVPAVQADAAIQLPAMKEAVYRSVAADMSDMLAKMMLPVSMDDRYPAAILPINASHSAYDWERPQASDYCDQYAQETVVQGANRPFHVDDAARQRYAFFYWHCMLRNGEMALGPGTPLAPAYQPVGAASPENPVNVSGTWSISVSPFPPARTCTFTQTGNAITGSCARSEGGGEAHGVVDGRQVRWSWTYLDDEKRSIDLDFIGMVGPDGSMTGQSIQTTYSMVRQLQPFTAVAGSSTKQIAYRE